MNTQTDTLEAIEREFYIEAAPTTVFGFLVEPAKMAQWFGADHTLDARVGGPFHLTTPDGSTVASGVYREVVPNKRVVFTWGYEKGGTGLLPGSTTVTFDLIPQGKGTLVKFSHKGFPVDPVARHFERHGEGWGMFLPRLVIAAEGKDPGPYPKPSAECQAQAQR